MIPFDVGGGTDVRSRFHLPWLKKYLKSRVNIVVVNKPGAGSISGTNSFLCQSHAARRAQHAVDRRQHEHRHDDEASRR